VVVHEAIGLEGDEVRQLASAVRGALGQGAVVVVGVANDGKAQLVAAVTPDLVARGLEARGVLVAAAALVGGGAGGSPELAQAGGRDASRLTEALAAAEDAAWAALSD
jgi:alanyl-tRNA synthetase